MTKDLKLDIWIETHNIRTQTYTRNDLCKEGNVIFLAVKHDFGGLLFIPVPKRLCIDELVMSVPKVLPLVDTP